MKPYIFIGGLIVALLGALVLLGKVGCDRIELQDVNAKLNEELMQANLEIGRANTKFGNANDHIGELEQQIQDEIKKRNAIATRFGKLKAELIAEKKKSKVKTVVEYYEGPPIEVCTKEQQEFIPGLIYQAVTPSSVVLIRQIAGEQGDHRIHIVCMVQPEPGTARDIPFYVAYKLKIGIRGVFTETITPTGAINHYATLYEVDENGDDVQQLKIKDFSYVVNDERSSRWYWWAPHLDIGAFAGYHTGVKPGFGGSLGFSVMGYGLTDNDLSWRVLRVSLDVSDTLGFGLTPGMYNLGELIPLISNLWIGPHVTFNVDGTQMVGLYIGAVL